MKEVHLFHQGAPRSPHRILTGQKGVQGSELGPDSFHPWICIYIIYLIQGINYPLEIAVRMAHFCGVIIRGGVIYQTARNFRPPTGTISNWLGQGRVR